MALEDYLVRFVPDFIVRKRYVVIGSEYADALSYTLHGGVINRELSQAFEFWQREHLKRGFYPLSTEELAEAYGNDVKVKELIERAAKPKSK